MAGIIETIKFAGTMVFAIPAAFAGVHFLLFEDQHLTGGVLLVLAAGLVFVQHWLTLPSDVPGLVADRLLETATSDSDSSEQDDPEREH